jgi:hypothetical protein
MRRPGANLRHGFWKVWRVAMAWLSRGGSWLLFVDWRVLAGPLGANSEWRLFRYFTRPAPKLTAQRCIKEVLVANDDGLVSH